MSGIDHSEADRGLLKLIANRDAAALARFYDDHAGSVSAYCQAVCSPELADEAVLAAFVDLLARADATPSDAGSLDLLRRGARAAAAARMEVPDASQTECYAMPELIAAAISGELMRDDASLRDHLTGCAVCENTEARLRRAEEVLASRSAALPPAHVRGAWLQLATDQEMPEPGPHVSTPGSVRVRARRGGLLGTARRLTSSSRRSQ